MRCYLELQPNAPDAQNARDQMLLWQGKLKPQAWTDPETKLMWAKQDNGSDVNWSQATDYCANFRLWGYSNWRLPSLDELSGIYDKTQNVNGWHIKGGIKLSACCPWSSTGDRKERGGFYFDRGQGGFDGPRGPSGRRALCVRRSGE